MNAEDYKKITNSNNVLDYLTLTITVQELLTIEEFKVADEIKRILDNNSIKKPLLHSKQDDNSTTFYKIDLSSEEIEIIRNMFFDLEVHYANKTDKEATLASYYASLVDQWNNLLKHIAFFLLNFSPIAIVCSQGSCVFNQQILSSTINLFSSNMLPLIAA